MRLKIFWCRNGGRDLGIATACLMCALLLLHWWVGRAMASVEPDVGAPDIMVTSQVETFLEAAELEMSEGDAAAALAEVAEGLIRHPDDPRLLARRADILSTQPVFREEALKLYQRLLQAQPGDLDLSTAFYNYTNVFNCYF